jgi:hypothetical protein
MMRFKSFSAGSLVPLRSDHGLKNLAVVTDGVSEITELAARPHKDPIQMPAPLDEAAQMNDPPLPDLPRKHWAKPVRLESDGLVADIDPALGHEVLDVAAATAAISRTSLPRRMANCQNIGMGCSWHEASYPEVDRKIVPTMPTIHILSGEAGMWYGESLEQHLVAQAGDFLYISISPPACRINPTIRAMRNCVGVVARTNPNNQESVILLPGAPSATADFLPLVL